ncbi:hypothetical protein CEXT_726951 [Caerostris extrusa]|uniref:Uncharacterized protein n=1 Tax=Caerostris extrusa TaxID=172846 RepID=A0AAV4RHN0_CAEEX|nr:hypothetical protein CEXT_726951 [Caerostris extrusa]
MGNILCGVMVRNGRFGGKSMRFYANVLRIRIVMSCGGRGELMTYFLQTVDIWKIGNIQRRKGLSTKFGKSTRIIGKKTNN